MHFSARTGTAARVEVSNVFGSAPLAIADVHLAQRPSGSTITNDHAVTFGSQQRTTIPPRGRQRSGASPRLASLPLASEWSPAPG
jgi:hypothetical protein